MAGGTALELLARVGFLVKGALYIIVGVLALQVATNAGGQLTGTSGALLTVVQQPFGRALLIAAAAGLLGYALWRVLQGVVDSDRLGHDWRGLAMRTGFVLRGLVYGSLGIQAIRLYRGLAASRETGERQVAAEALEWPFGDWLLIIAGLILVAVAVQQLRAAYTGHLEHGLDVNGMRREAGGWAVAVSRFGVAARAVVFALIGWTVIAAGWSRDPTEVGTTATTLRTLASQPGPLGRWLFGLIAAGFVAYGFYSMIHARYLHIRRIA
jgi:hypothetical protein